MFVFQLCFVVFVSYVAASDIVEPYYKHAEQSLEYQLPCMTVGGKCMQTADCPASRQVPMKGLCPIKQDEGVECCYTAEPKKSTATACRSKGGDCVPASLGCPDFLLFSTATDCAQDEECCIFIR